jgi:16S rRNA (guanine(966)-N(2))-methyltransferase RsmD
MRVIAGSAKGRRIKAVPGTSTRPITDRAKSALFSILGQAVSGSGFLDLFAGTGQVGIEALSRGAAQAVFVERARAATRTIRENLARTKLAERATVVQADVFAYLARQPHPFDYVFVAPPQYRGLWSRTMQALEASVDWLQPGGLVIVQIHPREYTTLEPGYLVLTDQRTYGSVMLCFYSRSG